MLLTKSRIPLVAAALMLLLGFLLVFIVERASADNAAGSIPAGFGDDTATTDPSNHVGWDWVNNGTAMRVSVWLGSDWLGDVFGIEVFIDPAAESAPIFKDRRATAYPSGQVLNFDFDVATVEPPFVGQIIPGTTNVGVHLLDAAGADILISDGPTNTGLLVPAPTPTPTTAPTATPVPTTEVPSGQVTVVAAPTGGAAAVIQPSQAASVSAPDGNVVVSVPVTANATTFQLVYNPSPASVPAAPADTSILRAFELNAHDTSGTQITLSLVKTITITVKYTAEDLASVAQNSPVNLKIVSYSSATQAWTPLNTTLDLATQTLTAKVGHLSLFALAGVTPAPQVLVTPTPTPTPEPTPTPTPEPTPTPTPEPTPTPTPELPSTGDWTPGGGLLLALLLTGFLAASAGGVYLTQVRRIRT